MNFTLDQTYFKGIIRLLARRKEIINSVKNDQVKSKTMHSLSLDFFVICEALQQCQSLWSLLFVLFDGDLACDLH